MTTRPAGFSPRGRGRPKLPDDKLKKPRPANRPKRKSSYVARERNIPQTHASMTLEARKRVQERLVAKADEIKLSPLEVMLETMKMFYDDAQAELRLSEAAFGTDVGIAHRVRAKSEAMNAVAVAEKCAPYIHSKLQSTIIRGDTKNPVEVALGLMDAGQLREAIRGVGMKIANDVVTLDMETIEEMPVFPTADKLPHSNGSGAAQ